VKIYLNSIHNTTNDIDIGLHWTVGAIWKGNRDPLFSKQRKRVAHIQQRGYSIIG